LLGEVELDLPYAPTIDDKEWLTLNGYRLMNDSGEGMTISWDGAGV